MGGGGNVDNGLGVGGLAGWGGVWSWRGGVLACGRGWGRPRRNWVVEGGGVEGGAGRVCEEQGGECVGERRDGRRG